MNWYSSKILTDCDSSEKMSLLPYYIAIKHHHISGHIEDVKELATKCGCSINSISNKIKQIIDKGWAFRKGITLCFVSTRDLTWKKDKITRVNIDGIEYGKKRKKYIKYFKTTVPELKIEIRDFMISNDLKRRSYATLHHKFTNATSPLYPKYSGLEAADNMGRSRTTASRHLKKMKERNIISIIPVFDVKFQDTSYFQYVNMKNEGLVPDYAIFKDGQILVQQSNNIQMLAGDWEDLTVSAKAKKIAIATSEIVAGKKMANKIETNTPTSRKLFKKPAAPKINGLPWVPFQPKDYVTKKYVKAVLKNEGFSVADFDKIWKPEIESCSKTPQMFLEPHMKANFQMMSKKTFKIKFNQYKKQSAN